MTRDTSFIGPQGPFLPSRTLATMSAPGKVLRVSTVPLPPVPNRKIVTTFAAALALALVAGCSLSTMERHTVTAGLLHEASSSSARVINAAAQRAADDAIHPCTEQGAPAPTCESVLDTQMRIWHRVAAAQALFAASSDAYRDAVVVAAVEDDPDWGDALRLLGAALEVYREVAALCAEYGVDLPALTRVMSVIGGDL